MAFLAIAETSKCIIFGCNSKLRIYRHGYVEYEVIAVPSTVDRSKGNNNRDGSNSSPSLAQGNILCMALSTRDTYLAIADSNKLLHLYTNSHAWQLLSTRETGRCCTRLVFSPDESSLLTADKSGDVNSFSTTDAHGCITLLLGHLSILIDVTVSKGGNYVVSCDRDEKVRVGHFPNAYNIHSFCLGHTSFVSRVLCASLRVGEVIISGSGDGTVRVWNLNGRQLHCVDLMKCDQKKTNTGLNYTQINDSEWSSQTCDSSGNTTIDDSSQNETSASCGVKNLCFSQQQTLLAVSFYSQSYIQLYCLRGDDTSVTSQLVNEVMLQAPPWDMCIYNSDSMLCVIIPDEVEPLQLFTMSSEDLQKVDIQSHFGETFPGLVDTKELWDFLKDAERECGVARLQKVKMNYAAQYYERKQQRIISKRKNDQTADELKQSS